MIETRPTRSCGFLTGRRCVWLLVCLLFEGILLVSYLGGMWSIQSMDNYPEELPVDQILAVIQDSNGVALPAPLQPSLTELFTWLDGIPLKKPLGEIGHSLLRPHEYCTLQESDAVAHAIDRGIACLHAFWPFEAMRAFREGLREGGQCCSLYWGLCKLGI